eukprot:3212469-Karenia_brevis.AAC.1
MHGMILEVTVDHPIPQCFDMYAGFDSNGIGQKGIACHNKGSFRGTTLSPRRACCYASTGLGGG